ncbi:MAG: hypothetical protein HY726_00095 [Candidatus Rokubacteria bacterium]|nr:hypothetical protein [Candidatus Rokubacteria bacterium]
MDRPVGKTKHGELSLDEIAGLQPGLSEWMLALAHRVHVMYFACKAGNWPLGMYQLRGIRKILNNATLTRPKYKEALEKFSKEHLDGLDEAMRRRSWEEFDGLIAATIEAADRYHVEWGYPYIRYRIPDHPPGDYLLAPPETEPPKVK